MAFKVSVLWEIQEKKKNKQTSMLEQTLECLMDGTFPSTCFQNKIDVGPQVSIGILSPGPRHLDPFLLGKQAIMLQISQVSLPLQAAWRSPERCGLCLLGPGSTAACKVGC